MELIKNFGIEPTLLIAQVVNFAIVLFILKKLLYKPVFNMLKKRENTIKEGLKQAEEARLLMQKTLEEEKEVLKKAQNRSEKMIKDAKEFSLELSKKAKDESKKQAEIILIEAKNQIAKEAKETEEKLMLHVSNLSVEFLQKAMKEFFSQKDQEELLKKAVKKLKEE